MAWARLCTSWRSDDSVSSSVLSPPPRPRLSCRVASARHDRAPSSPPARPRLSSPVARALAISSILVAAAPASAEPPNGTRSPSSSTLVAATPASAETPDGARSPSSSTPVALDSAEPRHRSQSWLWDWSVACHSVGRLSFLNLKLGWLEKKGANITSPLYQETTNWYKAMAWAGLCFVLNSRGNKAAANLRLIGLIL